MLMLALDKVSVLSVRRLPFLMLVKVLAALTKYRSAAKRLRLLYVSRENGIGIVCHKAG